MAAGRRLKHEGSLTQLPSGSWRAQISLQGHRISKTFPRQKQARDWLNQQYQLKQTGHTYAAHTTTLGTLAQAWLTTKAPSLRPATIEQYTRALRLHLLPALGPLKLADLTPAHIQAHYDHLTADLQQAGRTSRPLQVAHTVLNQILNHATRLGLIPRNPATLILLPKFTSPPHLNTNGGGQGGAIHVWTETQVTHFLASLTLPFREGSGLGSPGGILNAHLYHLAIATGLRRGELIGLQWDDIDWLKSTLTITRQVTEPAGGGWAYQAPKTRAGIRTIPLGPGLLTALRHQQAQLTIARQIPPLTKGGQGGIWQEHNLIFPNSLGKPQNGYNLSKEFHRLAIAAGLPPIRFHDLRHTAASLMLMHGIPLIEVSHILGHSRPSITLDIYAHYIPTDHTAAATLMDTLTTIDLLPLPLPSLQVGSRDR